MQNTNGELHRSDGSGNQESQHMLVHSDANGFGFQSRLLEGKHLHICEHFKHNIVFVKRHQMFTSLLLIFCTGISRFKQKTLENLVYSV